MENIRYETVETPEMLDAIPITKRRVFAKFENGEYRLYETYPLVIKYREYRFIDDPKYFYNMSFEKEEQGVVWNDCLGVTAEEIYHGGSHIDFNDDDFEIMKADSQNIGKAILDMEGYLLRRTE